MKACSIVQKQTAPVPGIEEKMLSSFLSVTGIDVDGRHDCTVRAERKERQEELNSDGPLVQIRCR